MVVLVAQRQIGNVALEVFEHFVLWATANRLDHRCALAAVESSATHPRRLRRIDARPPDAMPLLVIDTNIVLEWLWFRDPRCDALGAAVGSGQVRWIASAAMHDELAHVLARGIPCGPNGDAGFVFQNWQRWVVPVEPAARATPPGLRCTDADDQKFIDLAWQAGASALLSRDRAVLKLARRARALGLHIGTVEAWQHSR